FYFAMVALTAQGGLPEMIYKNVLTFHGVGGTDQFKDAGDYSSLFYVKVFNGEDNNGNPIVADGTYVLNIGVLGGITAGCLSAFLYNRLKEVKLRTALSFFGGRRFIPMVAMVMSIGVSLIFAVI